VVRRHAQRAALHLAHDCGFHRTIPHGLFAIEVKSGSTLRPKDRRGLLAFHDEFPGARLIALTDALLPGRDGPSAVRPIAPFPSTLVPGEDMPRTTSAKISSVCSALATPSGANSPAGCRASFLRALGRDVVLKLLMPELASTLSAERFTREIKMVRVCRSRTSCRCWRRGRKQPADGLPWFPIQYVTGEPLRARLTRGRSARAT